MSVVQGSPPSAGRSFAASTRTRPAGLGAGAPLSRIDGPAAALALVASDLRACEAELASLVMSDVAEVPAIAGYLLDAGGKRLRPALTALAARTIGYREPVARLMCVGELLHLGSLLHDDVVDDGEVRRGRTAAHRIYGAPATVLTGDFCLARSVLLAAEEGGHAAVSALGATVTEMAEGEVLQLRYAGRLDTTVEQYMDVVDRKSAALIAWCVSAPALAAGDPVAAQALRRFGRGVGRAFQIADDVLDYAEGTGKATGADLRERKVTLPLVFAMDRIPGLREELTAGPPVPERVRELVQQVRDSGSLELAQKAAHDCAEDALAALDTLPPGEGRDALRALGLYLADRTR
jgi:octaprenyl-diphosphate synthase